MKYIHLNMEKTNHFNLEDTYSTKTCTYRSIVIILLIVLNSIALNASITILSSIPYLI